MGLGGTTTVICRGRCLSIRPSAQPTGLIHRTCQAHSCLISVYYRSSPSRYDVYAVCLTAAHTQAHAETCTHTQTHTTTRTAYKCNKERFFLPALCTLHSVSSSGKLSKIESEVEKKIKIKRALETIWRGLFIMASDR